MYGSTFLSKLTVALLILTNVPLCICLNLRSLKILTLLGSNLLIPLILITNAILGWAGTWMVPDVFAFLLASIWLDVLLAWSDAYCCTLFNNSYLFVLLAVLLFSRSYLRVAVVFWSLASFNLRPYGFGGTFFSTCMIPQVNINILIKYKYKT